MTYRTFVRPSEAGHWDDADWVRWLDGQGVIPSVGAEETGVCFRCFGPTPRRDGNDPWHTCFYCDYVYDGYVCAVVPICYSVRRGLESALWRVKNDPAHDWLAGPLARLLRGFLGGHGKCLEVAYGRFDVVTVVPSHPAARDGADHMKRLVRSLPDWPALTDGGAGWDLDLLAKTRRQRAPRRSAAADLFTVGRDLAGLRVLLVDDTYTSGATMASAAHALRAARAERVVGLTLGRQLNTHWPGAAELIARVSDRGFDPDACAVHVTW